MFCIITVANRKAEMTARQAWGSGGGMSKSNTLPRNMGSRAGATGANIASNRGGRALVPTVGNKKVTPGTTPGQVAGMTGAKRPGGVTAGGPGGTRKLPSIRSCDSKLAHLILDEIIEGGSAVTWDDISGQEVSSKMGLQNLYAMEG